MQSTSKYADHLFELETALHKRHVRNSPEAVSELLADEFMEFGSSGKVWDKPAIIESLRNEAIDQQIAVEEFTARELAPDVALVTYIASKPAGLRTALRSSIWKLTGGRWQMIFHQGTRIPHA
jgi:glyoxylase I family protein